MNAVVRVDAWDIRQRLLELDAPLEPLIEAAKAGHSARILCSPNDPPFIPGLDAWRYTLRTLRDLLMATGRWRKDDLGNFSLVINDEKKINIMVASGDGATGRPPNYSPRTKTKKGLYTKAAVQRNQDPQGALFPQGLPELSSSGQTITLDYPTWIFLIYSTKDELRAELSFPKAFDEKMGEIMGWAERIIIGKIDIDPTEIDDSQDSGPDFDVEVSRKG